MDEHWLSVVPPLVTNAAGFWSRRVLPSLLFGLLVGGYLLNPTIVGGLDTAIEKTLKTLSDEDSLRVLLFLYLFSGLVGMVRRAGGINAFSRWLSRYVKSETGVLYTLWALIPVTFIDCAFRIVGAGAIVRALAAKHRVSRERIAFMLNNTASPVVELVPIATTFVGFNIANIDQGLKAAGAPTEQSAYGILLRAIPFEFFSLMALLVTFLSMRFQWRKASADTTTTHVQGEASEAMGMAATDDEPEITPRVINLAIPMLLVILLSLFFFWYFGIDESGTRGSILSAIAATEPNKALLVALCISMIVTALAYLAQKYTVRRMTADVISGGNQLM